MELHPRMVFVDTRAIEPRLFDQGKYPEDRDFLAAAMQLGSMPPMGAPEREAMLTVLAHLGGMTGIALWALAENGGPTIGEMDLRIGNVDVLSSFAGELSDWKGLRPRLQAWTIAEALEQTDGFQRLEHVVYIRSHVDHEAERRAVRRAFRSVSDRVTILSPHPAFGLLHEGTLGSLVRACGLDTPLNGWAYRPWTPTEREDEGTPF